MPMDYRSKSKVQIHILIPLNFLFSLQQIESLIIFMPVNSSERIFLLPRPPLMPLLKSSDSMVVAALQISGIPQSARLSTPVVQQFVDLNFVSLNKYQFLKQPRMKLVYFRQFLRRVASTSDYMKIGSGFFLGEKRKTIPSLQPLQKLSVSSQGCEGTCSSEKTLLT